MELLIWGSGGFARETAWLASECDRSDRRIEVRAFVDDTPERAGIEIGGVPVRTTEDALSAHPNAHAMVAIGIPQKRAPVVRELETAGVAFATLVHPNVVHASSSVIGEGSAVFPGCTLTTDIRLGRHVQLNPGCSVGHDAVIGDGCTLFPGARISGWVELGERVLVGAGAVVINGTWNEPLRIGADATVGAAACVTRPVPEGRTVVGVPARQIAGDRGSQR